MLYVPWPKRVAKGFDDFGGEGRRSPTLKLDNFTKRKRTGSSTPRINGNNDHYEIEPMKKKLMLDLEPAADRMRKLILEEEKEESPPTLMTVSVEPLTTIEEKKRDCSTPPKSTDGAMTLTKLRSDSVKKEKVKLVVELSNKEVEEDFMKMLGNKPLRKPNRRPKIVQKHLDGRKHVTNDYF
ncbi:hypothetical protein SESBI_31152 [Sesbania bispinosa]|nr:hypothetical protein SESBI_31152 [Sesbania bispinosa]